MESFRSNIAKMSNIRIGRNYCVHFYICSLCVLCEIKEETREEKERQKKKEMLQNKKSIFERKMGNLYKKLWFSFHIFMYFYENISSVKNNTISYAKEFYSRSSTLDG